MSDDRTRWNHRHTGTRPADPSPFLLEVAELLPTSGAALDVAGGTGRNALWLAQRGMDVTIVDVSEVALDIAGREATARGLTLTTRALDLRMAPPPEGPWNLVLMVHYLQRPLIAELAARLVPGGVLVCEIATVRTLERSDRPPRRFLLSERRLPLLTGGLETLEWREEWTTHDRHVARYVGRRSPPS
jgi:tellurite methyltransferase